MGNPTQDLVLADAPNEDELRQDVLRLKGKYSELKVKYYTVLHIKEELEQEFDKEMRTLRELSRKFLEGYFTTDEQGFLAWLRQKGEGSAHSLEERVIAQLDPEEQKLCKSIYHSIAHLTHSDKSNDPEMRELFNQAAEAYKTGNLFALRFLWKEMQSEENPLSELLSLSTGKLLDEKYKLEWLLSRMENEADSFEFAGVNVKGYYQDGALLRTELFTSVRKVLLEQIRMYQEKLGIETVMKPEPSTAAKLASASQGLMLASDINTALAFLDRDALVPVPLEEQLGQINIGLKYLREKLGMITPYYTGHHGEGIILKISEDESVVERRLQIFSDSMDYGFKCEWGCPEDVGNVIELSASFFRRLFYLEYAPTEENQLGRFRLPPTMSKNAAGILSVLSEAKEILSKPLRCVEVSYDTHLFSLLGHYDEYTNTDMRFGLRTDDSNEIIINRIMRTILLAKVPRLKIYDEHYPEQYVINQLSGGYEGESFLFDEGELEKVHKQGEVVQFTAIKYERKESSSLMIPIKVKVKGVIEQSETRKLVEDTFHHLLGCREAEFEGYFNLEKKRIPFHLQYQGMDDPIGNFASGFLRACHGDIEIRMLVNYKEVVVKSVRTDTLGLDKPAGRTLKVEGIDSILLPDLLYKVVGNLVIDKVNGTDSRGKMIKYL